MLTGRDELVFGTDGWRDVIAERFTFENVRRAADAYATELLATGGQRVVVGHDTRFLGDKFARAVAERLAERGLEVLLSAGYLPTPALSFAVLEYGADGGVMITASHNPYQWNGFKLKGSFGGTASDATYRNVAAYVAADGFADEHGGGGAVDTFDVRAAYFDKLAELVDLDLIARLGRPVLHDAMGGAAAGWLRGFFEHVGLPAAVVEFRGEPDPMFYGTQPEPIASNLGATVDRMTDVAEPPVFAAATDGDGDRLGVVLPGGAYFGSHETFALLIDILQSKGGRGTVVKTFTVSRIVERLARARGLSVEETKVGFKYVTEAMVRGGVLIGGEESGGIGVTAHLPERDGIANTLLLLEGVALRGVGLAEWFAELERETGWRHAYGRNDLRLSTRAEQTAALAAFDEASAPEAARTFGGRAVSSVERLDGIKLNLADDAWLLMRPSGTEPLLRVYCEGPGDGVVEEVLRDATALALEAAAKG